MIWLLGNVTPQVKLYQIEALAGGGDYASLSNKPQINGVTLSGNKTLSDLGVTQNGGIIISDDGLFTNSDSRFNRASSLTSGSEYDFSAISVGDTVINPTTTSVATSKRGSVVLTEKTELNFLGNYEYIIVDYYSREVLDKVSNDNYATGLLDHYENTQTVQIYINFYNVDLKPATFYDVYTAVKLHAYRKDLIDYTVENLTATQIEQPLTNGTIYDISGLNVGDIFDETLTTTASNSASCKKQTGFKVLPNEARFYIKGKGTIIYVNSSDNTILGFRTFNTSGATRELAVYDNCFYYINFEDTNVDSPYLSVNIPFNYDYVKVHNMYKLLTEPLYLNQDGTITPSLIDGTTISGFYYVDNIQGKVYYYDNLDNTTECTDFRNSLVYYDSVNKKMFKLPVSASFMNHPTSYLEYDNGNTCWQYYEYDSLINNTGSNAELKSSIVDANTYDDDFATIGAIKNYINKNEHIKYLGKSESNVNLWQLETGIYKIVFNTTVYSYPKLWLTTTEQVQVYNESVLIITNTTISGNSGKLFYLYGANGSSLNTTVPITMITGWCYSGTNGSQAGTSLMLSENTARKVTSIDNTSTDVQYPSAKCVYDNISNKVSSSSITEIWKGTQAQYDLLTPSATTLYIIE